MLVSDPKTSAPYSESFTSRDLGLTAMGPWLPQPYIGPTMKICRSAHSKDLQFRQRHPGCGELHARFPPGLHAKDQARSRKNQAHRPRASTPCALGSLIHGSQSVPFPGHPSLKHIFEKAKGNRLNMREDSLLPASSQGFPVDKASFLRPSKGHTVRVLPFPGTA